MFGSGLVTLSRHPILRHQFWRYAAGGFATAISCGDYYAGKGAGARLLVCGRAVERGSNSQTCWPRAPDCAVEGVGAHVGAWLSSCGVSNPSQARLPGSHAMPRQHC